MKVEETMNSNNTANHFRFLGQLGLFHHAEHEVHETQFDELAHRYHLFFQNQDWINARLFAEKMSICYGVQGLIRYFDVQTRLLAQLKKEGELIDQDLIKTLSLICYLEKELDHGGVRQEVEQFKEKFLALADAKTLNEICCEALDLSRAY